MGIEKTAITLRADAKNLEAKQALRDKYFPLASDSAVLNHMLMLARKVIEGGFIDPITGAVQALRCSERSGDERAKILAWMIQIGLDQLSGRPGPRKAEHAPETRKKRSA